MGNLHTALSDLTTWCVTQPGHVLWNVMQTFDNGRRGFQLAVHDHEAGRAIWHCNSTDLADVGDQVQRFLRRQEERRALLRGSPS